MDNRKLYVPRPAGTAVNGRPPPRAKTHGIFPAQKNGCNYHGGRRKMFNKENRANPRAELKWPVFALTDKGPILGETKNVSTGGAYVCCPEPLRLNEVIDLAINSPEKSLNVKAEVVWSNIYGPDDKINPRGMGVRFLDISNEDRKFIAQVVNEHCPPEEVDLEELETIALEVIDN
ncbi:MAG: PilZ domain-containing protein [Syntrophobacterales bacterium]